MMTLQQRLKSLRLGRLLTQKELAGLLNVSQNAIYNWENGNREPNKEMIEKIASLFDVSPADLMGWENERTVFIADNLKKIMELKNISSSELANLSDLPICEIDDILENGRAPVSYISKLAAALDVTIKYLTELEASEINQEKLNSQLESTKIVKITMELHILNANGLDEAYKQIKLLSKIPEYRNDNNSEDSPAQS